MPEQTHTAIMYAMTDAEGWTFYTSDADVPYMVIDTLEAQYDQHLRPNPDKGEKREVGEVVYSGEEIVEFNPLVPEN